MKKYTLEERKKESLRIIAKYPDRIPVIVEKDRSTHVKDIDKHKYLVPADISVGQFIFIIRKRLKLAPEIGLYLFIDGILPPTSAMLFSVYDQHHADDGFLYVTYSGESTFG